MLHHDRTEIHFKPNPFQVGVLPQNITARRQPTHAYSISDQL